LAEHRADRQRIDDGADAEARIERAIGAGALVDAEVALGHDRELADESSARSART
jgi:hypothetical protein